MPTLWALTGVNKQKEGFVHLKKEETTIAQLSIGEAREFAQSVLECAEAAETDSFIVRYLLEKGKFSNFEIGAFLKQFRLFRESHGGTKTPTKEDFKDHPDYDKIP